MPTARSVARALLAALGVVLVAAGVAIAVPAYGEPAFPAGLALGLGILLFAAGGAALGGAALLSGRALSRGQRLGLKVAGCLAIAAFVLPVGSVLVAPGLVTGVIDAPPILAALVSWLYLSTGALVVAFAVAVWWALGVAYERLVAED